MRTAMLVVLSFLLLTVTATAQPGKACASSSQLPHFAVPHVALSFDAPKAPAEKPKHRPFNFADQHKRKMDCTGIECGCEDEHAACVSECPGEGEEGHAGCLATCNLQ